MSSFLVSCPRCGPISILILLTIYFLYESKQISDYNIISKDANLSNDKKKELLNNFSNLQNYLLVAIFGVTLSGTYLYANEKQVQYGGGFSYFDFFFN
jgi:uncharacterized membrane protein